MDSSKNEVLIAIFLGILIGFVAVLSYYFVFKNKLRSNPPKETTVQLKTTPKSDEQKTVVANFDLSINPEETEIISEKQNFTLRGQTENSANLIVQTDFDSFSVKPDAQGNFSFDLKLEKDINHVVITAVSIDNLEKTIEKVIYYNPK